MVDTCFVSNANTLDGIQAVSKCKARSASTRAGLTNG